MNNNPTLSIIVPFYNRIHLLKNTIKSIKNSIDNDFELILVDDGSEEHSYERLKSLLSYNIFYYKIKNSERGFARNYGAKKARGLYVNFFDSDDICYENHVSSFKNFILKYNYPNIFANSYKDSKKYKNSINKGELNSIIFLGNILSCNSVFIKREVFLNYKFSENRELSGSEDWDLWLRIAVNNKILGNHIVSTALNNHNKRSTIIQDNKKTIQRLEILKQRISNPKIISLNTKQFKCVLSEIYSFQSMVYSTGKKNKMKAIKYLAISLKLRPIRFFYIRTTLILKNLLFNLFIKN
ncbi:MAG: hypothetical protein CMI57_00560 [Parcubacteria group bacterium]|jgi:glycosyltransferase involved in cell wall biosynthesis|nr:hypothetical protein [Parcubacteria group bacterium]|tara:strand:- start:16219 stop:17109 length:891 start_codon:yes stop_codon:yes gene_type:complete